jgi:hypothetical protein
MKGRQKKLYNICREIYEKVGQSGVFEYIGSFKKSERKDLGISDEYCNACEDESPSVKHTCLVCGSETFKDLFNYPDKIPKKVRKVLETFDENGDDYQELARIVNRIEKLGYTFDYYLSAEPYNLRKIKK